MQLRVAQEQADRARPDGVSTPGSYGSLRALTVGAEGGTGTHSSASARLLIDPRLMTSMPGFETPPQSWWKRPAGIAAAAIGAVALFALGQFVHWGPAGGAGNAAAPSPAPAMTAPPAPPEPVAAPPPAAAPAVAAPPLETTEERKESAPGRRGTVVRKGPVTPSRPNNAPAQSGPSAAPSAPPSENNRTQNHDANAPNAWDPGSFGGRR